MIDMVRRDYLPAVSKFVSALSENVQTKRGLNLSCVYESSVANKLSNLMTETYNTVNALETEEKFACSIKDKTAQAVEYSEKIVPMMDELREKVDAMEVLTGAEYWPVPTYGDMTYYVD